MTVMRLFTIETMLETRRAPEDAVRCVIRRAKGTSPNAIADKLLSRFGGLESFLTKETVGEQ